MPQPTGGKVNASNLNVEGLDEVATPVATDVVILGRDGEQNQKVPLSAIGPAVIPDPLLISAGLVGAPGLGFTGDTDTGIFSPAADIFAITAGGVEVARFSEAAGVAQLIVPFQNNPATPSIAFGDGDTGFRESADDTLQISIGGLSHTLISSQWIFRAILSNGPGMLAANSTATVPNVLPNRDDLNTGLGTNGVDVMALIAGGVNVANCVTALGVPQLILPSQNNVSFPSLAFGDGDTGFYENFDDGINVAINGIAEWQMNAFNFGASSSSRAVFRNVAPSATVPLIIPQLNDLDTGIGKRGVDTMDLIAGGQNCIAIAENAGAPEVGFYGTVAIPLQTGVAVTAAAIHAALVALGLITA